MFTDQDELLLRAFGIDSEEDTPAYKETMRQSIREFPGKPIHPANTENEVWLVVWIMMVGLAGLAGALLRASR